MEAEKLKTRELKIVMKMALEMFDEFRLDEDVFLFPNETEGIENVIKDAASKTVEVAKKYKLPRKATAAIVLAVAMSRFLSFTYLQLECRCKATRIIKAMKELGFRRVRDKCVMEIVEGALAARWNTAEEFFEALGRNFIVLDLPHEDLLIFEPIEE